MKPLIFLICIMLCGCTQADSTHGDAARNLTSLGARLYSDPRLSVDGKVSCATCHNPARAFADGRRVSVGVYGREGTRNAPSLLDLEVMKLLFWDGREQALSSAVLQPFTNQSELGHKTTQTVVDIVDGIPEYRAEFSLVLGRDSLRKEDVGNALVAYLNSLDKGTSRYERAVATRDLSILSVDEIAGLALFRNKAQCGNCHLIGDGHSTFTDNRFHHAGIGFDRIAGNIAPLLKRLEALDLTHAPLGHLVLADRNIAELGHFVSTRKPQDLGAFRTPSLRNVANTAPYMHDGSVVTLEDAVARELYYRGIALGRPINLTVQERQQVTAFLRSLSVE